MMNLPYLVWDSKPRNFRGIKNMSISGKADYSKPSRRRHNDSGELDVFEAARYFSGYNDSFGRGRGASYLMTREERHGHLRAGRTSLDLPSLKYHHHHQYNHQKEQPSYPNELLHHDHNHQKHHRHQQQEQQIKDKKYKQPSSPGERLAHFFNTLFNQAITSKKKRSSKSSSQRVKDEDESPSAAGRRRRSSVSHFRSTSTTAVDTKSLHSSCSSFGFRSPPPHNNLYTPTKFFRSFSDHKEVLATSSSKYNTKGKNGNNNGNAKKDDRQTVGSKFMNWADEKLKFENGLVQKITRNSNHGDQENKKEAKKLIKEEVDIDGLGSDSSSDLFELQIDYGFGFCSSGLPVYETTHLDSIKRPSGTALINGSIQS